MNTEEGGITIDGVLINDLPPLKLLISIRNLHANAKAASGMQLIQMSSLLTVLVKEGKKRPELWDAENDRPSKRIFNKNDRQFINLVFRNEQQKQN